MLPNPECGDFSCRKLQHQYKGTWSPNVYTSKAFDDTEGAVTHADNEWGIESAPESALSKNDVPVLDIVASTVEPFTERNDACSDDNNISLEELMKQLKNVH